MGSRGASRAIMVMLSRTSRPEDRVSTSATSAAWIHQEDLSHEQRADFGPQKTREHSKLRVKEAMPCRCTGGPISGDYLASQDRGGKGSPGVRAALLALSHRKQRPKLTLTIHYIALPFVTKSRRTQTRLGYHERVPV